MDDLPRPLTLEEEREASRKRREDRDEEAWKRLRFPESQAEWAFLCGNRDPNNRKIA